MLSNTQELELNKKPKIKLNKNSFMLFPKNRMKIIAYLHIKLIKN